MQYITPALSASNLIKNYNNTYLPQKTITDKTSKKHFGILLSTQKSIEEFQIKSGMKKAFTTEYQYHYWALVARIKLDDEILDIAIPTVMFNYKQTVNHGAVSFHLNDVEEASNRNQKTAETIAEILVNSSFGEYLKKTFNGQIEWMNVPMNTCHVHPGNLSSFSGTDYSKNIKDPGICFPLSEPQEQASFSSIICHIPNNNNTAKIVRTEYRNATLKDNDINYLHGTCLSYWRGYTIPGKKIKLGLIKSIFSNKEYEIIEDIAVEDYTTTDGPIVIENNEFLLNIITEFNKIEFSPITDDILAERIISNGFSLYNKNSFSYKNFRDDDDDDDGYMSIYALRTKLKENGYGNQVETWGYDACQSVYKKMIGKKKKKQKKNLLTDLEKEDNKLDPYKDFSIEDKIIFMLDNGLEKKDVIGKDILTIEKMFSELMENLEIEEWIENYELEENEHYIDLGTDDEPLLDKTVKNNHDTSIFNVKKYY